MRTYIHHLKNKPEHTKNHIAFVISFVFTFFIFIFWLSSKNIFIDKTVVEKESSPFESLSQTSANVINSIKKGFNFEKEYVVPDLEVVPEKK